MEAFLVMETTLAIVAVFVWMFMSGLALVDRDRELAMGALKVLFIPVTWPYWLYRLLVAYGRLLWAGG